MRPIRTRTRLTALVVGVLLAAGAAACGDDDTTTASTTNPPGTTGAPATTGAASSEAAFPVTIEATSGTSVTIDEQPDAIVSLSPTATELLFAIGAGDQVIAADEFSNYPPEAPRQADLSGYEPNLEAIAAYEPDLVVAQSDPGGLVDGLAELGVPTLIQFAATTLDDTYTQIHELGLATGAVDGAAALEASMRDEIEEIIERAESAPWSEGDPLTYYHELDNTLYTATSNTFIGELYTRLGLENIADAADDGSGYPQLSAEYIFEQDPDFIFLADTKCCGQSAETLAARPGWNTLTAVRTPGRVVELDDDIASRWGPRVVEFLEVVLDAMTEAQ
jgi:iron complex transport system substrate-binding protein